MELGRAVTRLAVRNKPGNARPRSGPKSPRAHNTCRSITGNTWEIENRAGKGSASFLDRCALPRSARSLSLRFALIIIGPRISARRGRSRRVSRCNAIFSGVYRREWHREALHRAINARIYERASRPENTPILVRFAHQGANSHSFSGRSALGSKFPAIKIGLAKKGNSPWLARKRCAEPDERRKRKASLLTLQRGMRALLSFIFLCAWKLWRVLFFILTTMASGPISETVYIGHERNGRYNVRCLA